MQHCSYLGCSLVISHILTDFKLILLHHHFWMMFRQNRRFCLHFLGHDVWMLWTLFKTFNSAIFSVEVALFLFISIFDIFLQHNYALFPQRMTRNSILQSPVWKFCVIPTGTKSSIYKLNLWDIGNWIHLLHIV